MPRITYLQHAPRIGNAVQLAPDAFVVGRVTIEGPAHVGLSAVIRADQNCIMIAPWFCLGDGSSIHVEAATPTIIDAWVWVGAGAVVHAAHLETEVRVEDGSVVLSGSRLGAGSIVEQGSLVPEGASFPEQSYLAGIPARRLRDTTASERSETRARITALLRPNDHGLTCI